MSLFKQKHLVNTVLIIGAIGAVICCVIRNAVEALGDKLELRNERRRLKLQRESAGRKEVS